MQRKLFWLSTDHSTSSGRAKWSARITGRRVLATYSWRLIKNKRTRWRSGHRSQSAWLCTNHSSHPDRQETRRWNSSWWWYTGSSIWTRSKGWFPKQYYSYGEASGPPRETKTEVWLHQVKQLSVCEACKCITNMTLFWTQKSWCECYSLTNELQPGQDRPDKCWLIISLLLADFCSGYTILRARSHNSLHWGMLKLNLWVTWQVIGNDYTQWPSIRTKLRHFHTNLERRPCK